MLIGIRIPLLLLLALVGCSRESTSRKSLGGSYYEELTVVPDKFPPVMEPGNNNRLRYVHIVPGQTNEITRFLGGFGDSIHRQFSYRIYGSNFVYVERENGDWSKFRLRDYSAKNGNVTIDDNFRRYWKVIADEHGITCHRYQDAEGRDDPNPVVYKADYLSGL